MKRYPKTILCLLILITASAILPPVTDTESRKKPGQGSAILSQSVFPASLAISEPAQFWGRISTGLTLAGWYSSDIKNTKAAVFGYYFPCQQSAKKTEITLFSLDCLLQI